MPIEFRCSGCDKLLRVPDEAAGKAARCPHCGAVNSVPGVTPESPATQTPASQVSTAGEPFGQDSAGGSSANPFRDASNPPVSFAEESSLNPYQSPATGYDTTTFDKPIGELTHTRLEVIKTMQRWWKVVEANIVICLLFGLILLGIGMGFQMISIPLSFVQVVSQDEVVFVIVIVLQQLLGQFAQAVFTCLSVPFALEAMRRNPSPWNRVFGSFRFFGRILGFHILYVLMVFGIVLVCFLPVGGLTMIRADQDLIVIAAIVAGLFVFIGIWSVWLNFCLTDFFIVDRNQGVFEAMRSSKSYMRGNRWKGFLAGVVMIFLFVVTCFFGIFFGAPLFAVFRVVMYRTVTGQWAPPAEDHVSDSSAKPVPA